MSIAIVTDSASDVSQAMAGGGGVTSVPLYVRFGEKQYRDEVDLGRSQFYQMLVSSADFPTTSQPAIGDFIEAYSELAKTHTEILSVHISGKLSKTYAAAVSAKQAVEAENPNVKIEVVDSHGVSVGSGILAIEATKMAQQGMSLAELKQFVEENTSRAAHYVLLDSPSYLVKGGRIGKARGLLGSLLRIKPLLELNDGEASPLGKPRSFARGMDMLASNVAGRGELQSIFIGYTTDAELAEQFGQVLQPLLKGNPEITSGMLSPVVGAHLGPSSLGICTFDKA